MKRKRGEDAPPKVYKTTDMVPEVREMLAKMSAAWARLKWKSGDFTNLLQEADVDVPYSTLRDWRGKFTKNGAIFVEEKRSGNEPRLKEAERMIFCGHVMFENDARNIIDGDSMIAATTKFFRMKSTRSMHSGILNAYGISSGLAKGSKGGYQLDREMLRAVYRRWRMQLDLEGFTLNSRLNVASLDLTFASHRTSREMTYRLRNRPQPKSKTKTGKFTDCVLTCLWADGKNRTPPMLFTYDQAFRTDRKSTALRDEKTRRIRKLCKEYGITESQIVYVGKEKYEKRSFVREKHELIEKFFRHHGIPPQTVIFADNGNSTKRLRELGFHDVKYYPAVIHQYLSPNDNGLHGPAKATWKSHRRELKDNVDSSLFLLKELATPDAKTVQGWFKNCWLLDIYWPKDDVVDELLGGGEPENHFYQRCRELYREYVLDPPKRGGIGNVVKPCSADSELDGSYWTEWS